MTSALYSEKKRKYAIGLDFGSESGRALLVDVRTGEEVAEAEYVYENGVISEALPETGQSLPPDFALQDPRDYLRTLERTIPRVVKEAGIDPEAVVSVGVDSTSCTVLPTREDGTPLCFDESFRSNPHAWVKLWKHHAAEDEANEITELAKAMNEKWLVCYGGKIQAEWLFPKILETLRNSPEVYEAADRFIEAGEWVVWQLTGVESRSEGTMGYKAMWSREEGFPSADFFGKIDPRLKNIVSEKISPNILPLGAKVGYTSTRLAHKLGLAPTTAVATSNIDAHVSVPAAKVAGPGTVVLVMGTSLCHMTVSPDFHPVEGIGGIVKDGIIKGYWGYEAGQPAVGDILAWFVGNAVPEVLQTEASKRGIPVHAVLSERAARIRPGGSGLLALDWWNGNRSILANAHLSGLLVGLTLDTRPDQIYRALIEGIAFGTLEVINALVDAGVEVDRLVACGGIPHKNKLMMQIFADVTGREIRVARTRQSGALGAAMYGAVAAGSEAGGYDSIAEAVQYMAHLEKEVFIPDPEAHRVYQRLHREYRRLHDYFGRGENDVMATLRRLREEE